MVLQQFVLLPFMADAINSKTGRRLLRQPQTLWRKIVRTVAFLALAAGAMLFAVPTSAFPLTGGASQGYSDYLDRTIIEVKGGRHGHRHHARGGHRHHHHVRHHRHHRHFAFRFHRRHHHARGWYDPCPYGYVLSHGRCVPYYVR